MKEIILLFLNVYLAVQKHKMPLQTRKHNAKVVVSSTCLLNGTAFWSWLCGIELLYFLHSSVSNNASSLALGMARSVSQSVHCIETFQQLLDGLL